MLSQNQEKVMKFIATYTIEEGIPPTLTEIGDATYLSISGARKVMISLAHLGYIRRKDNRARAIRVLRWPEEVKTAA